MKLPTLLLDLSLVLLFRKTELLSRATLAPMSGRETLEGVALRMRMRSTEY